MYVRWKSGVTFVRRCFRNEEVEKTQPRIRFDLEKLNDTSVMSAFQATIGGRFFTACALVDEYAELDSIDTQHNKVVTAANNARRKGTVLPTKSLIVATKDET